MFLRVEQKWMPSPFLAREREAKPKGQEHEGRRAQKSESAECERKKVWIPAFSSLCCITLEDRFQSPKPLDCHALAVVLFCLSCSIFPGSCFGCLGLAVLLWLFCSGCFFLAVLSFLSFPCCLIQAVLCWQPFAGSPVVAALCWQPCSGSLVQAPVLAGLSCLFCPVCSVLPVPLWLSRSGCPVLPVVFWMSFAGCPFLLFYLAVLSYQSCAGNPILAALSRSPVLDVLVWQSCVFCLSCSNVLYLQFSPFCPLLSVLSWMFCPCCLILAALSSQPLFGSPVLLILCLSSLVLFCLSISVWPVLPVLFCLSCSGCCHLLSVLPYLFWSTVAFMYWQPCPGSLVMADPALAILFCLSCSACLVLHVLFCLFCFACPFLPVCSTCLSCSVCSVLPSLFCLSCSACPIL